MVPQPQPHHCSAHSNPNHNRRYRKSIAQSEAQGVEYELEGMAQTHTNLGHALLTLSQSGRKGVEDPEPHYRKALQYDAGFVPAYTGLSEVLEAKRFYVHI